MQLPPDTNYPLAASAPVGLATTPVTAAAPSGTRTTCIHCSYSLEGLNPAGTCPECGKPVADSLRGLLLRFASPQYVAEVRSGLSLYLNGILVYIIVSVATIFAGVFAAPGVLPLVTAAALVPVVMMLIGFWKYTVLDPGYAGQENPKSARQVARSALAVSAITTLISTVLALMSSVGVPTGTVGDIVSSALGIVGLVAWVVQFFAGLLYTRWMFTRVPDAIRVNRTKLYLWLLPVLFVVGMLILIGPLVALVLFWNHLDVLRKHLKSIT